MQRLANRDPYRVGLAAVAVLAVLAGLTVIASTVSFGTKTYKAHIEHTAGLRAGEDVQIAGVHVGQVKSIKLNGTDVLVTFDVSSSIRLGSDTEADVKVATLLGTHYLAIDPQGSGNLKDDTIPLSQTEVPFNLQDVIDRGTAALNKLDPELLAKALTTMSEVTEASQEEFGPALEGVARASAVIATRSNQAGELLEAARAVTDQLSDSSADILDLMKSTTLVLDEIRSRRAAIHSLLVRAAALADAINSIVGNTKEDLGVALKNTQQVLAMLKRQDKTLKNALSDMAPAVRYLANATGNGPWIDATTDSLIADPFVCKNQGTC